MSNPYDDHLCSAKTVCVYCGSTSKLTRDHILPKSKGGSNDLTNIQLLCQFCNYKKNNKTEIELKCIFADIKKRGVWYEWEQPYSSWLSWLEVVCKERGHKCSLWKN